MAPVQLYCMPFCVNFFFVCVQDTEPGFIRKLKMEVLASLVSGENSGLVMKEFTRYVADADPAFVVASVLAVGRIADAMPELAPRVLGGLMGLVNHSHERVVAASVVVIRQLLQRHPANEVRPPLPLCCCCRGVLAPDFSLPFTDCCEEAGDPVALHQDPRRPQRHRVDPGRVPGPGERC